MSLLRQPPEKIALYALLAFGLAIALTVFNVICSYLYFRTVAPGGGWIGFAVAVGASMLVNVIESGTVMILLSGDEVGHLFTPPRITIAGFPLLVSKLVKFGIIGLFGFVLAWTYKVDLESTKAVIQAKGSIGWYVVAGVVFGSEFLMILGHTLWGVSKYGKLNTAGVWKDINARLRGQNGAKMPQGDNVSPIAPPQVVVPPKHPGGLAGEAKKRA